MVPGEVGRVALMSIHPEYASAILAGTKKVEFRKRPIAPDVTHVIVYATAPVRAVVGAFSVSDQEHASPRSLWDQFADVGGIADYLFFAYFADRPRGVGIQVGQVLTVNHPVDLVGDLGVSRPPQSFQYLRQESARPALAGMRPVS